jgi:Leucine-rich repeat (LRR) protein
MKGLCAFVLLFPCFFSLASCQIVNCPAGAPPGCKCRNILDNFKVECEGEADIKDIPPWLPRNTTHLAFEGCAIGSLNQDSFKNFTNLTTIKIIKQNDLTFNDMLVFQGLNRLLGVDFSDDNIASLPAGLFANFPRLRIVTLSNNPLATLPQDLLENSTNVQFFRIGNTEIDKDVIAKIGNGDFGKNIQSLLISGTPIKRLKNELFSGLPKLSSLALANCQIEHIGADILKGTKITSLALDGNHIKSIDENAFRGSKVSTFSCQNCQLRSNVTFNGFLNNMSLRILQLPNNKLSHIPKNAFTDLEDLTTIDLSNNLVATIEDNAFENLRNCKSVHCIQLQHNPLNCDCNLAWFRSFADKIQGDKSLWKCANPQNVAGTSLVSLKVDQFCCEDAGMPKCGTTPDPNSGWTVSAQLLVAIVSQIVLMFGIPLLFT